MIGIIIASMTGCGKSWLMSEYNGKNVFKDMQYGLKATQDYIDDVASSVNENDIVFVDADISTLKLLCENGIYFDLFYPSTNRKGEFIENQVKKRAKFADIAKLDHNYNKMVEELNRFENPHCMKHVLSDKESFIGNNELILKYLDDAQLKRRSETHESKKILETDED